MASATLKKLSRSQVRYWCFRFRTELEEGVKAAGAPRGLRPHFEKMEFFALAGGWAEFASRWDVAYQDPLRMVARISTIWQDWNSKLAEVVPELPIETLAESEEN